MQELGFKLDFECENIYEWELIVAQLGRYINVYVIVTDWYEILDNVKC